MMTLADVRTLVETHTKSVRVSAADPAFVTELREYFESRNVEIIHHKTPENAPANKASLFDGNRHIGTVSLDDLVGCTLCGDSEQPVPNSIRQLSAWLRETTFAAETKHPLQAAVTEIVDRATRTGHGTLYIAQRSDSTLEVPVPEGRDCANGLSVRHLPVTPGSTQCVAFDGGGDSGQKCAIIAESEGDSISGFWTYDPGLTDAICASLQSSSSPLAEDAC